MRLIPVSIVAALLAAAPAIAQDAAAPAALPKLKAGQMIRSSDGRAIGRISDVRISGGQPVSVSIIYNQHFIHVPANTLTAGERGLVTSLSQNEVASLN